MNFFHHCLLVMVVFKGVISNNQCKCAVPVDSIFFCLNMNQYFKHTILVQPSIILSIYWSLYINKSFSMYHFLIMLWSLKAYLPHLVVVCKQFFSFRTLMQAILTVYVLHQSRYHTIKVISNKHTGYLAKTKARKALTPSIR